MTQTDTPLSAAEMLGLTDLLARSSNFRPSHVSLSQSAARTGAECSPMRR
jgi:hypothetical protein